MATSIPSKLYVTFRVNKARDGELTRLGFSSPYTNDSVFAKRKLSQDQWAYGSGTDFTITDTLSVIHGPNSSKDVSAFFISKAFPRIETNEPRLGFELAKSVRRSSWHGSSNVVWQVEDPLGFELEITSENFALIVSSCTIINGVIQEACVWGRDGSRNVLLPVSSEPYKTASIHTTLITNKISIRNVSIGDHITLITKTKTGNTDGVYMGRMIAVISEKTKTSVSINANTTIPYHLFYNPTSGNIFAIKNPVVGKIQQLKYDNSTLLDNINEINGLISNSDRPDGLHDSTILMVEKLSDAKNVKITLSAIPFPLITNSKFAIIKPAKCYFTSSEVAVVTANNTNWFLTSNCSKTKSESAVLVEIDYDKLCKNILEIKSYKKIVQSYYQNNEITFPSSILTTFDSTQFTANSLNISCGKYSARILTLPYNLHSLIQNR